MGDVRTPTSNRTTFRPRSVSSLTAQRARGARADDDDVMIRQHTQCVEQVCDNSPTQGRVLCLSGHLDDATACSRPRSTAVNQRSIAAESAATKAGGGEYDDLTELFCTTDRCPIIVGNTLVYFDGIHVTIEYARALAPIMGALVDRTLTCG